MILGVWKMVKFVCMSNLLDAFNLFGGAWFISGTLEWLVLGEVFIFY